MNSTPTSDFEVTVPVKSGVAFGPDWQQEPPIAVAAELGALPLETAATATSAASVPRDLMTYDPVVIERHYGRQPLRVVWRFLKILWPLLVFYCQTWLDGRTGRSKLNELKRSVQLREMLTRLGPAYIKIGQALSTRPDLVPPMYLDELTKLQDQLPPFANAIAFRFIEEELGAIPQKLYAEISPQPVAAASLGQVYKGRLKTGETVAIKVQRPGLAQQIALDLYILRQLAKLADKYVSQVRSDLTGIMDEFGARIFEEMDYTHEGQNAERFDKLYGHLRDIYVPSIHWDYTGRRVLTMEWIEGTKLTQTEKLRAQGIDASYLIDVGVQCSLRQLLEHGFFHADPHPGNLLATTDGQLAYLDFGMMSEVKPYQRYGLIEAVVHMVNRDFEGLATDYVKLDFLTPDTNLTPIIPALARVFNNALGASVAELNFKSITDEFSALMYEYPFRVPAYYALIIRSLVTLEGIAINVDPDFKVLSKAYPYIAKRLLTDPAPELRASLNDLLFRDGSFRWNRLENLLRNARNSDDYDLNNVLSQTLEFLFSERGEFFRDRIADEVVKQVDNLGQDLLHSINHAVQKNLGIAVSPEPTSARPQGFEHITRILSILRETRGFDAATLASVLPQVLLKRETREMGQRIVGGLAQRAAARLIRGVLLTEPEAAERNGHRPPQRSLPPVPVKR
ncbi:MAG: AarF/ABC1/UbiB kinase family protein [Leptolyngbyaceae cyanobacterium SM1_1_3]|nr:AarF/ABC1/UbiB kinase family protein [Leptolyngbyaceae cyanobacterium SM1_1_3]NJN03630.1 AarF/ABC1/UbiB kinase family protein [Leptolyngbyaceae cyanobacterium RM1_1_2]